MATPAPIPTGYKNNFETLLRATENGDLALVSALEAGTDKPAYLICAIQDNGDGSFTPIPLARMIDGNPFELFQDPTIL